MSVVCNRCEKLLDSKLELVIHFWLAHHLTIEESERATDSLNYVGVDSGCAQATQHLGYPSNCQRCPFKHCTYDKRGQRLKQRNNGIRKLYRKGIAITEIAVIYRVSPRTVQRTVQGVRDYA